MANRNQFTDKFQNKSNSELEQMLTSKGHVHEAKLAAKWILEERESLPELIPNSLTETDNNPFPNGVTFFDKQSSYEKTKLKKNLIQVRKDSRLEFIIYGVMIFVAPYIAFRPGQTPLIESMTYWEAVGFFSIFLGLFALGSFIFKAYSKIRALQTNRKKVIAARVLRVEDSFNEKNHVLTLQHENLKEYQLSKFNRAPNKMDYVRLEFSELGNQLIKIETISEEEYIELAEQKDFEDFEYKTFLEVFTSVKAERLKLTETFSLFIPKGDHFITPIILLLNFLVFILMLVSGVDIYRPEVIDIVNWGGNAKVLTLEQGQYWRLLTSVFVHVGITHILMNSIGFLFAAALLEHNLGRQLFVFVYISTGILASLTSALWNENMVSAGASGAIFGLYGFILAKLLSANEQQRKMNDGLIITIFIYVLYNLIMGLTGNIDNAAHIGGLLSGIIMGVLLKNKGRL